LRLFSHFSHSSFSNTYLLAHEEGGEALLIDPGKITLELIDRIEKHHFQLKSVLLTHRHDLHSLGVKTLLKIYKPQVYVGAAAMYDFATIELGKEESQKLGTFDVKIILIPGHSLDSLLFKIDNLLFSGDVLLAGKIGSTNSELEKALLIEGIKRKIFPLPDDLIILPGHGPLTTLKIEKIFNRDLYEIER